MGPHSGNRLSPTRDEHWLLLTDYASKYRISVSTLRRRIKAGSQPYHFEGGRYYLPDHVPTSEHPSYPGSSRAGQSPVGHDRTSEAATALAANAPAGASVSVPSASPGHQTAAGKLAATLSPQDEPLITTTSKLLNELKQAYTLILHEKEEQIIFLKNEIADLKTLVRVLESENSRLVHDRERHLEGLTQVNNREKGPFGTA